MKEHIIFLILKGRIGNQLFQYAIARMIQEELGENSHIIIDESEVLDRNWTNSLSEYPLPGVEYVQDRRMLKSKAFIIPYFMLCFYYQFIYKTNYRRKYKLEKTFEPFLNRFGLVAIENGYLPYKVNGKRNTIVYGFFQSELYFEKISSQLKKELDLTRELEKNNYPNISQLKERNSICISIKVEHNVEEPMYDVCKKEYWEKAIEYMLENVRDPVFFVCSDNVEYVKEHLIDCQKYDVLCQAKEFPVHFSLAAMSLCKHFIIGNTTYGWWAQYLSANEDKIVVAPKKWMNVDMPVDIYANQKGWHLM